MSKPCAPAAERNARAILAALRSELTGSAAVLEIGSGTGQHAVQFARELPDIVWQPSDVAENVGGIRAWVSEAGLSNARDPIVIDVLTASTGERQYDAVFSANTAHIMHLDAVVAMFALSADALAPGGIFALYGPFRQHGRYNTPSNADFDLGLRRQDPGMGIRDIELLDEMAGAGGMHRLRSYAMPANNHLVIWSRVGNAA